MAGGGTFCKSVEASELDAAIMLSAVNVLTNQIFQLLRGSTPAAVRVFVVLFHYNLDFGMLLVAVHSESVHEYLPLTRRIVSGCNKPKQW